MVFGDDPEKAELLMPLGRAVRKYYTLRDYDTDIAAGFVNIPRESVEEHGITRDGNNETSFFFRINRGD